MHASMVQSSGGRSQGKSGLDVPRRWLPRQRWFSVRRKGSSGLARGGATRGQSACAAVGGPPPVAAGAPVMQPDNQPGVPSGQQANSMHGPVLCGLSMPLGAHYSNHLQAHNFALFSGTASAVSLVLFTDADLQRGCSTVEIELDPVMNRTGEVWHAAVPGLRADMLYGYRVFGGHEDDGLARSAGLRHDGTRVLLDPYATSVVSRRKWGQMGPALDYESSDVLGYSDTWPQAAAVLPNPRDPGFDWQGDRPLNLPMEDLVIYEAHVRGFTAAPSSAVSAPGTYAGMTERLDYLQRLGVTAIELLPVFEFNELEYYTAIPGTDLFRYNFWGYSTVAFFAPMSRFSTGASNEAAKFELKMLVREAHIRGIEVVLDVVFNHTAEGNELGPHISFRGIDNRRYYMLAPEGQYYNYSGCGNTMNCNDPITANFIVDCLRFWVQEYHIDGFRFDLAAILTRAPSAWHPSEWVVPTDTHAAATTPLAGAAPSPVPTQLLSNGAVTCEAGHMTDGSGHPTGTPLSHPPCVETIAEDPVLRHTKLIAEAWDCDGLNQVGAFPHYNGRWAEWNGHFRDTIRNFIKGTDGDFLSSFASALMGSPELYAKRETHDGDWWGLNGGAAWRGGRSPLHSVNFITAHDGFTMADLVAYNQKHNVANGENNNDGESNNLSWNCGVEGPTTEASVLRLRSRQQRNMAMALLLSQGIPMLLMGDEYGHTKDGNNNTYCHDSKWNYLDWDAAEADSDGLRRFWTCLIHFRRQRPELGCAQYGGTQVAWHGELAGSAPAWGTGRFIAMTMDGPDGNALYVAFNTKHEAACVDLPVRPGRLWRLVADTGKPSPLDFMATDDRLDAPAAALSATQAAVWSMQGAYPMLPWSSVVLESVPAEEVEVTGGLDRWDNLRPERTGLADAGVDAAAGVAGDAAVSGTGELVFGTGLVDQGIVSGQHVRAGGQQGRTATQTAGPTAGARADGGAGLAAHAVPPATAGQAGGSAPAEADSAELERLAAQVLGTRMDFSSMSPVEREEMLQVLRENLALQERLNGAE